ncbi:MAG: SDR family oxidoreductase [Candidatus Obscuribacterales bacterium]|nr:SDR family oxidoreductase [Candidatus Obscuribacterales bacterium]
MEPNQIKVLVTGSTGYVGTRLVTRLLENGFRVVAAGRSLEKLKSRVWSEHPLVELVQLDMLDLPSVKQAVRSCTHAYYLVHSMNPQSRDFVDSDRRAAENMVAAAEEAQLEQLIYLGGLGENEAGLSRHLRSRAEVAEILQKAKVPVTVLRAAMILGSGSASFEILRYLVERLPMMVTPRWVSTASQPIAIRNVLAYLIGCLDRKETFNCSFDIGGPEVLTYKSLMKIYAEEAGLSPRLIIPVPVFTPRLSSYWINFVTPVPAYIARPLAEGLRNPAVCLNSQIKKIIPQDLLSCREAIRLAVDITQHSVIESHWTDAGVVQPAEWLSADDPSWSGGTSYIDERSIELECSVEDAWKAITRIGGTSGWYYANWLWHLRGLLDRLLGGVGLKRGRRHPEILRVGDALDFWRVTKLNANEFLSLAAEMKLPGRAALEFRVKKNRNGKTVILQSAKFLPRGLLGILYWYLVSPLHEFIFSGMLTGIAASAGKNLGRVQKISKQDPRSSPVLNKG